MSGPTFVTTHWSQVLAVRTTDVSRRRAALSSLCEAYWYPLYAFVRRRGHDADGAADLVQAFFAHVIEKEALSRVDPALGRFRTFLLAAVKNFLANEWNRQAARKRGGAMSRVPFDPPELERRYAAVRSAALDPEQLFDRQWAATVLERAVERLRAEQARSGKAREFEALRAYLTSDAGPERPYRAVAADLGIAETAARAAVHRLRQRLGASLRAEVLDTVGDATTADVELRHLLSVLAD